MRTRYTCNYKFLKKSQLIHQMTTKNATNATRQIFVVEKDNGRWRLPGYFCHDNNNNTNIVKARNVDN